MSWHGSHRSLHTLIRLRPVTLVIPVFWFLLLAHPAAAQDGKTIIQHMLATYRSLKSYRGRTNANARLLTANGSTTTENGFTTALLYQKPNKLKIDFMMPQGGRTIYYDGKTLTYFQNKTQTFSSTPVVAEDLPHLSVILKRLQIVSRFDALFFLTGNNLPDSITDIARRPDAFRDRRAVYVVTAHEKTPTGVYTLTWMIDKQTNLLARMEEKSLNAPTVLTFVDRNKKVIKKSRYDRIIVQNIIERLPNADIDPAQFVYHAPQTAKRTPFPVDVK